jgi:hypothetical protein
MLRYVFTLEQTQEVETLISTVTDPYHEFLLRVLLITQGTSIRLLQLLCSIVATLGWPVVNRRIKELQTESVRDPSATMPETFRPLLTQCELCIVLSHVQRHYTSNIVFLTNEILVNPETCFLDHPLMLQPVLARLKALEWPGFERPFTIRDMYLKNESEADHEVLFSCLERDDARVFIWACCYEEMFVNTADYLKEFVRVYAVRPDTLANRRKTKQLLGVFAKRAKHPALAVKIANSINVNF